MKLRLILICLFMSCSFLVHTQVSISLEAKTGYSSYAMDELSHTLNYYQENSNLPLKITNDYPAYLTFGGSALGGFKKFEIGVDYSYLSTGGRAHYKDYSGEVGYDQLAVAHSIGLLARYSLFQEGRFSLKGSLLIARLASQVNFSEFIRIGSSQNEDKLEVVSTSVGISPMIESIYNFTDWLYVGLRVGGFVDTNGELHLSNNTDAKLIDDTNKQVHSQWSGFRSEFFIGVKLH